MSIDVTPAEQAEAAVTAQRVTDPPVGLGRPPSRRRGVALVTAITGVALAVLTGRDGTVNWQVARVAVVASAEPVHNARSVIRADGLEQCATSARADPVGNHATGRWRRHSVFGVDAQRPDRLGAGSDLAR